MKIVTHVIAAMIGAATGIVATWIITNKKRDKEKEKLASRFNDQLAKLYSEIDALNDEIKNLKAVASFREEGSTEENKTEVKKIKETPVEQAHPCEEDICEEFLEPEDIVKLYPINPKYNKQDVEDWLEEKGIDRVLWTTDANYRQLYLMCMEDDLNVYEEKLEAERRKDEEVEREARLKANGYQQISVSAWSRLTNKGYSTSVVEYYPKMFELYNRGYMDCDTGNWIDDTSKWGDYVLGCVREASKANCGSNLRTLMFADHSRETLLMIKIWIKDTFPLDEETKEIGGEKD